LTIAENQNLKSIAFPNISTGIYHFPKDKAAEIAIETVKSFQFNSIEEVVFVCFDDENYDLYKTILI
jgi:O-acetyl-ADP-ribose deacetylase (regulator of RNase III)